MTGIARAVRRRRELRALRSDYDAYMLALVFFESRSMAVMERELAGREAALTELREQTWLIGDAMKRLRDEDVLLRRGIDPGRWWWLAPLSGGAIGVIAGAVWL